MPHLFQVHPDASFRDLATKMLQKGSAVQTAITLNRDVYKALAALDLSKTDAATRYYVERQLLEFRLAGVDKDDAGGDYEGARIGYIEHPGLLLTASFAVA